MSTLRVSVVSKLSILVVLCAVLALVFVPKTARAVSMSQPEYGISAVDLNLFVKDNTDFIHSSNYKVEINIPVGSWTCAKAIALHAWGRPVVVPPKKFARLIMSVTSNNLTTMRIINFYSGNANIIVGTTIDSANFVNSWEHTSYVTIDVYNPTDLSLDFYLGGNDPMVCGRVPSSYAYAETLMFTVNSYVVYSSASSSIQNELAQEEKNAQNNIKNQSKDGDNNNNPTAKSQTLMDYFKNGIGAIQKMKKTNCNLKLDMGVVKFDEVDMCKLKVPSYVKIISSILVFTVCVPASIAIVRRIVAVVKEMQQ